MRAAVILLALQLMLGCQYGHEDDSYAPFYPHVGQTWRTTPAGHVRDADPKGSVQGGFVSEEEIDEAIDLGFAKFYEIFPEFLGLEGVVNCKDDYVEVDPQTKVNAPGLSSGSSMYLCLWSRGASTPEPFGCYLKRAPGEYFGFTYTVWRFTKRPLFPSLLHELLHVALGGDPNHTDPRWSKVPA